MRAILMAALLLLIPSCSSSTTTSPSSGGDAGGSTSTESPLAGKKLVEIYDPKEGATNVDVLTTIKAKSPYAIGAPFTEGGRRFQLELVSFTVEQSDTHANIPGKGAVSTTDSTQLMYGYSSDPLPSQVPVTATVVVRATEFQVDHFAQATALDGTPLTTTATVHFTSGLRP